MIKETIDMLGHKVRDRVTSLEGVVESVAFDLYGCVTAYVKPAIDGDGKMQDGGWFDVQRLEELSAGRVMPVPDFDKSASKPAQYSHGAASKPAIRR